MKCPTCRVEMLRIRAKSEGKDTFEDHYICRFSSIVSKDDGRFYIPCRTGPIKCSTCKHLEHTKDQMLKCKKLEEKFYLLNEDCEHYREGVPKTRAWVGKGLLRTRIYTCPSCNLPMVTVYVSAAGGRYMGICSFIEVTWKRNPFGIPYFPCEIKPPEKSCFTCKNLKETKDLPKCRRWDIEIEDISKQCEYYEIRKK